ncbi:MAG: phospholipase D-like domain-containing protein [Kiritimatiellae bacterium]|jgi:phosphatidylserine/phosphatidylglycerophosphate/cardiolipin synthase-like enzyme|nr:phospholipase D-like domain-containing protein [Kiritimatiellia bacterium]
MKRNYNTIFYIFSVIFLLNIAQYSLQANPTSTLLKTTAKVAAYFENDCETAIITHINSAKKEIHLAIYTFTRPSIYKALANAQRRNVKVEIKYDAEVAEWEGMKVAIDYMEEAGITCTKITPVKGETGKMHDKYLIIDKKTVITGSYNYTTAATTLNYENIIVVQSNQIADDYYKNFTSIK